MSKYQEFIILQSESVAQLIQSIAGMSVDDNVFRSSVLSLVDLLQVAIKNPERIAGYCEEPSTKCPHLQMVTDVQCGSRLLEVFDTDAKRCAKLSIVEHS